MDRSIIYSEQVPRSFDILSGWKDGASALAYLAADVLGGTSTMVAGLAPTPTGPTSLTINLSAGRVYQLSALDSTGYGSLALDSTVILQQGNIAAQQITLDTSGLTSGKSRWALIEAQFAQSDAVRTGDPTAGILQFFNSADPSTPLQGENNDNQPLPTVRRGTAAVNVIYGSIANTGSEVPPNASAGFAGLYLIDLTFGQTTIAANQILVAGPSVGPNVPSNYPQAPLLAGHLNAHHGGTAGQAPKINLTNGAEVQGVLPAANSAGRPVVVVTGAAATYTGAQIGSQVNRSNGGVAMIDILPGTSPGFITNTGIIHVFNNDPSALLAVTVGAGATLKNPQSPNSFVVIGPRQGASFLSDGAGTYYALNLPALVKLGGNTTLFVGTAGLDSNPGITAGTAFQTIQGAWNFAMANLDIGGCVLTVQVLNGAYAAGCFATGRITGQDGIGRVIFVGNPSTPANVTIAIPNGGAGFAAQNGAEITVQGVTISGNDALAGLYAANGGVIYHSDLIFGAMTNSLHQLCVGGLIQANGNYSISGGARYHMQASGSGANISVQNRAITVSGTPGFTQQFAFVTQLAFLSVVGTTFTGGATGQRYFVTVNSAITGTGAAANFFPGDAPGAASSGGLYL